MIKRKILRLGKEGGEHERKRRVCDEKDEGRVSDKSEDEMEVCKEEEEERVMNIFTTLLLYTIVRMRDEIKVREWEAGAWWVRIKQGVGNGKEEKG